MKFNLINLFNLIIVFLMLLPNIINSNKITHIPISNKIINIFVQIGRYGCITMMLFPLFVWKFAFRSVISFLIYLLLNFILLFIYYIYWFLYLKQNKLSHAIILNVVPSLIFLINGIILRHIILIIFATVFCASHIMVTYQSHK